MSSPALKLNLFVGFPSYGGNGGISSEVPDIREWWSELVLQLRDDPRIGALYTKTIADTPITMVRNDFVRLAKAHDCHLLMMVDSDQSPNKHRGEKWFKPFWDEAFNFIYDNYHKGPRLVFAPYVGPAENVYVFNWQDRGNDPDSGYSLEPYSRQQAALMSGIHEAGAGPTGLILTDMRLCDLIEPSGMPRRMVLEQVQSGQMSVDDAMWALHEGYFHYEWENAYANKKASTEDVTFTRNIALAGFAKLGYNPVFCAWDSWIGHHKPVNIGRPQRFTTDQVHQSLKKTILENRQHNEFVLDLDRLNSGNPVIEAMRRAGSNGHALRPALPQPDDVTHEAYRETNGPWHNHGSAPQEQCVLLADQIRSHALGKKHPLLILEVGTWLGTTAKAMADSLRQCKVHCVDTWKGSPSDCTGKCVIEAGGADAVYAEFVKRIGDRLNETIFPWRKSSDEASAMHWTQFDVIFIDAEHTYERTKRDILNWWPHLRDDGVMLGHDFHTHGHAGVVKAVEELFGEHVEAFGFHPQGCMWKVSKADHPDLLEKHNEKVPTAAGV